MTRPVIKLASNVFAVKRRSFVFCNPHFNAIIMIILGASRIVNVIGHAATATAEPYGRILRHDAEYYYSDISFY